MAALKHLALDGGLAGERKLTSGSLKDRLDTSHQTASRRLRSLETAQLITREVVHDGQWISITSDGVRDLRREYNSYKHVLEESNSTLLTGVVTSGMGEGKHYLSLPGYLDQFREQLGYEPYAGTLNVDLPPEQVRRYRSVSEENPIEIDGWSDEIRTYGPVIAYPVTVESANGVYETAHVIEPKRTHHDASQLELVADVRLREAIDVDDGEEVHVHVG